LKNNVNHHSKIDQVENLVKGTKVAPSLDDALDKAYAPKSL